MLHILLMILKITGIIIAVLIGCILLSLCLALFVPIHYKVELRREEGEGSPPIEVKAKVTWLLHFINIRVLYPSDIYLKVRILFFTLFRLPQKSKRDEKKKRDSKEGSKKREREKVEETRERGQNNDSKEEEKIKTEQAIESVHTDSDRRKVQDKEEAEGSATDSTEEQNEEPELSLKSKIYKIWNIFKNIWYTIKGICDKIKAISENIEYYLDIIKSDMFKKAFSLCKDELVSIIDYVKPRKFNAELIIGTDDPATTGQILSYYGILYPLIGNNVTVTGDFDRKRIEGSVFFKGRIKLFTFLKALIRIYFSKNIRKLLKLFKKEDA